MTRPDLTDFVTVEGGDGLAIEPSDSQICIDGVKHGGRYHVRVRGGLPAADGETLAHPVELDVYVRDRAPWVGFAGNAYVLPAGPGAVDPDRLGQHRQGQGRRSTASATAASPARSATASSSASSPLCAPTRSPTERREGLGRRDRHPADAQRERDHGDPDRRRGQGHEARRLRHHRGRGGQHRTSTANARATQWFVVTDLGLTTLSGNDGVHAMVRSLSTRRGRSPAPSSGWSPSTTTSSARRRPTPSGYARFDPGLARGTGGMAPQLVDAETDAGDYAFIDLARPAFDLTDRGVDGRPAPAPLDVF